MPVLARPFTNRSTLRAVNAWPLPSRTQTAAPVTTTAYPASVLHPCGQLIAQLLGISRGQVYFIHDAVKAKFYGFIGGSFAINIINERYSDLLGHVRFLLGEVTNRY